MLNSSYVEGTADAVFSQAENPYVKSFNLFHTSALISCAAIRQLTVRP